MSDASAVVKELMPELAVRCSHARKESNLRPSVLETGAPPRLERTGNDSVASPATLVEALKTRHANIRYI